MIPTADRTMSLAAAVELKAYALGGPPGVLCAAAEVNSRAAVRAWFAERLTPSETVRARLEDQPELFRAMLSARRPESIAAMVLEHGAQR